MKIYQALARTIGARLRCLEWAEQGRDMTQAIQAHDEAIKTMMEDFPSGSGFDNGTEIDLDDSTGEKLVFTTAYHHMNDGGMYDGWTEHIVTVVPSLEMEYRLRIRGSDRNDIKDYIAEQFHACLDAEVQEAKPQQPVTA